MTSYYINEMMLILIIFNFIRMEDNLNHSLQSTKVRTSPAREHKITMKICLL